MDACDIVSEALSVGKFKCVCGTVFNEGQEISKYGGSERIQLLTTLLSMDRIPTQVPVQFHVQIAEGEPRLCKRQPHTQFGITGMDFFEELLILRTARPL